MFIRLMQYPLNSISEIGTHAIPILRRLGIFNTKDLITHYPRKWEDRTRINPLSNFQNGKVCTQIKVISKTYIGFGKMKTLKVIVEDESARASLLCYNRDWLNNMLVTGNSYWLWGRFYYKYKEIQSSNFQIEDVHSQPKNFGKFMPVYPLTEGISQAVMRRFIIKALNQYCKLIDNELPCQIIGKYGLMQKKKAVFALHYPESLEEIEKAKQTLIYEELFYLEIIVGKRVNERKKKKDKIFNKGDKNNNNEEFCELQKYLINRLPFKLTQGQINAVKEINTDLESTVPMARLLQGDVGSGKTLVCFLAALKVSEKKGQTAIMAPTELLAGQHAETSARLLEPLGIQVAYLTGNVKSKGRKELLKNLKEGNIDIVIGTHALFSSDVQYKNLRLVIIDEQHRFGVTQRSLIMSKGDNAHLLMMSATPIPRTMALTVFGDMDVSVIKDMPLGRMPVENHFAMLSNEKKVYDFVYEEIKKGRQAYFVYPLIEDEEEDSDLKDAVTMEKRFADEIFADFKTGLIHSKLPEEIKQKTMEDFRKGEIQILAATSVVEVGVDVPNATCMVIEHAERFGLSALHQMRGRVGRGKEQSYCFFVYSDNLTEDAKARLKVMKDTNDGFKIAEEDLKLRGPGLIAGTEQSGYLVLGIANPIRDFEQLEIARNDAFDILENDPDFLLPDNRVIAKVLEEAPPFGDVSF